MLPLVSSWSNRGLLERSSENEDCLRFRDAGGEWACSGSGRMTAEATVLEVDMVNETVVPERLNMSLQRCFCHDLEVYQKMRCCLRCSN